MLFEQAAPSTKAKLSEEKHPGRTGVNSSAPGGSGDLLVALTTEFAITQIVGKQIPAPLVGRIQFEHESNAAWFRQNLTCP
jgi:hypothetical protein